VGPLDEQPLLGVGDGAPIVAMGGAHPDGGKRELSLPAVPSRQVTVR
jgi:hypothetical protein